MAESKDESEKGARRILIGGAEGHLGMAAVKHFASLGMSVAASCRTKEDLDRVRQSLVGQQGRPVLLEQTDLADEAQVARLLQSVEDKHGAIEAVFNCAGGFRWSKVAETSLADFEFLVAANLRTSFLLAKYASVRMRTKKFGRFVFVSSRGTLEPAAQGVGVYQATKLGINALVQALAQELKADGITANAVAPTVIDTPANRQAMPKSNPEDWVKVSSLLQLATMLVGPEGAPYNGAIIPVAGKL